MLKITFAGRLDMFLFGDEFNRGDAGKRRSKKILTHISRIDADGKTDRVARISPIFTNEWGGVPVIFKNRPPHCSARGAPNCTRGRARSLFFNITDF
jgi:hypothetical protein